MSTTYSTPTETGASEAAAYGGFVDALGGIATVVLTIIGLHGTYPEQLVSIATIVFGAALLIQGGAMLTEFAQSELTPQSSVASGGGGISALFLVGIAGIVLGVLALLSIHPETLTAVAVIAFGGALMLSSGAVWQLLTSRSMAARFEGRSPVVRAIANEAAAGSATMQAMAGLAIIILGILAVAGIMSMDLALIALLVAGASIVMTGSTLSATMAGFMRRERTPLAPPRVS